MNFSNEEFKEKIMNKYSQDIINLYMIQDYITLENIDECNQIISEAFKEENKKINNEEGNFSILVDKKYLLIAKNGDLKNIFKIIYKSLLLLSKCFNKNENFIIANIKEIISLINLILMFNDNITFYSLKKKIFILSMKNEIKNFEEILLSEYYFTHIKTKKCRKSLISWDYKYFLYENFSNKIRLINNNNNTNEYYILNLLKDELNLLDIKDNTFYKHSFILKDLELINEINTIQSRNYHMWTYLRKVYNFTDKEGKKIIILFSFLLIRRCSFDYSAFSFLVNSKKNMPLNDKEIKILIDELKKVTIIKYDEHKCYIDDLEKFLI